MPTPRLFIGIGLIFVIVQGLTYLAYRGHEAPAPLNFRPQGSYGALGVSGIRRKLWQTSKHAPMALDEELRENIKKWDDVNPHWRHEVLTDQGAEDYVRDQFAHEPDVVAVYTALNDNIMRADFFRYLCLYAEGGVYTDIDTEILKPIESWVPQEHGNQTAAVVGIEYDTFGLGRGQALLDLQLVNWTIMSRANHALLGMVIKNVISSIQALAREQKVPIGDIQASFNDVLAATGPVQLTRTTWQYLTQMTGKEFTWQRVTRLEEPLLVHDVLILPVTSFANGQMHSGSRPPTDKTALVHHQFKGSWKTGSHAYKNLKDSEKTNW